MEFRQYVLKQRKKNRKLKKENRINFFDHSNSAIFKQIFSLYFYI